MERGVGFTLESQGSLCGGGGKECCPLLDGRLVVCKVRNLGNIIGQKSPPTDIPDIPFSKKQNLPGVSHLWNGFVEGFKYKIGCSICMRQLTWLLS